MLYVEIVTENIEEEGLLFQTIINMNDEMVSRKLGVDFMPKKGAAVFFTGTETTEKDTHARASLLGFGTRALKKAKIKGSTEIVNGDILNFYNTVTVSWIFKKNNV